MFSLIPTPKQLVVSGFCSSPGEMCTSKIPPVNPTFLGNLQPAPPHLDPGMRGWRGSPMQGEEQGTRHATPPNDTTHGSEPPPRPFFLHPFI